MITPQLSTKDFTRTDVDDFRHLMSELVSTCQSIADQHPGGVWEPTTADLFDQFAESMVLMADVSRVLNKTRRGIRRIDANARQRLYERASERRLRLT
ncbi:hypothetical protein ACFV80_43325 [Streptomyces sp. NPDC059862]|uniref:hypothetical protein n=1 Tax=Streptomyces sp. NPDC059862 TaxID=3346975 RepID=UPI00364EBE0A